MQFLIFISSQTESDGKHELNLRASEDIKIITSLNKSRQ